MARIAFLMDDMFGDSEFRVPYERVRSAGHETVIVGLAAGRKLAGKRGKEAITTERAVEEASADEFDAVVIPGGYSPDHLRTSAGAVGLVRNAFNRGKPVAAICRAGWMLVEAEIADGRTLTSWPSIKTDLMNGGARWIDRDVVEDGNLITSRARDDLPAFCDALVRQIERGAPPRLEPATGPGLRHLLDRVVWYLRAHGLSFRLSSQPLPEPLPVPTAALPLSPAGLRVETQLLLVGGRPAIACAARGARLNLQQLSHELGVDVLVGDPADLPPPYSRADGPIPPLGGALGAITVVDAEVTRAAAIAFMAFSTADYIEVAYDDLARLERPRVASFAIGGELPEGAADADSRPMSESSEAQAPSRKVA